MNVKLHRLTTLESRVNSLYSEGKYLDAIELCEQLLEAAKTSENYEVMLKGYIFLAGCYYNLGKIENAYSNLVEYKKLCDKYGNTRDRFHLYSLSAIMYEYDCNYEKAKEMTQECINIAIELDMFHELIVNYNTYSTYLNIERKHNEAEEVANVALDLAKNHSPSDVLLQCQIHFNIALAKIGLGDLEKAKNILDSLKNNPYINDHLHEKADYLYVFALYYLKANDIDKALELLIQAYKIYSTFNNEIMLKRVLKEKIRLYEILGDEKNSYRLMKEYIKITDHLSEFHLSCKMTELDIKNSIAAIEKRANIDGLTGIYNRYFIETTCNQWIKEIKETEEHICCIIFDVDNFKDINDTFGHLIGDEVIKTVAQTTNELFSKENAIVGRYGGDEFIIFLRGYTNSDIVKVSQELFCTLTNLRIPYLKNIISITVSMGVACSDSMPYIKKFAQIFKLADQALYMAKKEGKNQIVYLSKQNCVISKNE